MKAEEMVALKADLTAAGRVAMTVGLWAEMMVAEWVVSLDILLGFA